MKTAQDIKKSLMGVSEEEKNNLQATIQELIEISKAKEVNEDVVKKLHNALTVISSLKENYLWRLLRAAKQNHMLDM